MVNVGLISGCVLRGISEATKLQGLVTQHRMILKNEVFCIQQVLLDNAAEEERREKGLAKKGKSLDDRLGRKAPPASPFRRNTPKPKTFSEREKMEAGLRATQRLLEKSDELIGYQEEVHLPVNVMGFHPTAGVYNSTVGILVTFLVLAVEGYASGGLGYDNGWAFHE